MTVPAEKPSLKSYSFTGGSRISVAFGSSYVRWVRKRTILHCAHVSIAFYNLIGGIDSLASDPETVQYITRPFLPLPFQSWYETKQYNGLVVW